MKTIELLNVNKTIKGHTVINDISLTFTAGKIYGLYGVNGSGKTMLMRLISGLIHPTNGIIMIDGMELGKEIDFPPYLGLLIENPSFFSSYSGRKNLKFIASINKIISDSEIDYTLERVGLNSKDSKPYRKYSLGMKQKLGIACAIMEHPQLLILDEPTNAVDQAGVEMITKIILEEKSDDAIIIVSSHDEVFLRNVCDQIYHMADGKITNV